MCVCVFVCACVCECRMHVRGMMQLFICYFITCSRCESLGVEYADSVFQFSSPGIGHIFLYMALEGLFFMILTIIIEVMVSFLKSRQLLKLYFSL